LYVIAGNMAVQYRRSDCSELQCYLVSCSSVSVGRRFIHRWKWRHPQYLHATAGHSEGFVCRH